MMVKFVNYLNSNTYDFFDGEIKLCVDISKWWYKLNNIKYILIKQLKNKSNWISDFKG